MEVLDYNGTHAKLFFSYQEGSTFSEHITDYNGDWIEPGREFKIMGSALTKWHERIIFVEGLGMRYCDVYGIPPGVTFIAYNDKEFGWPVRLEIMEAFHLQFTAELDLVETNIPGLKKT